MKKLLTFLIAFITSIGLMNAETGTFGYGSTNSQTKDTDVECPAFTIAGTYNAGGASKNVYGSDKGMKMRAFRSSLDESMPNTLEFSVKEDITITALEMGVVTNNASESLPIIAVYIDGEKVEDLDYPIETPNTSNADGKALINLNGIAAKNNICFSFDLEEKTANQVFIAGKVTYEVPSISDLYDTTPTVAFWPMDSATGYETPTILSPEGTFSVASFDLNGASVTGTEAPIWDGYDGTPIVKIAPANEVGKDSDVVKWNLIPSKGLTFIPTKISAYITRYGTDQEKKVNVYLKSNEGKTLTFGPYTAARANQQQAADRYKDSEYTQHLELELTDAQQQELATVEGFSLEMTIGVPVGKSAGFGQVKIEGLVYGEAEEVAKYPVEIAASPEEGGQVSILPIIEKYEEGTEVTLSANKNFGYDFVNWTDADGKIVSETSEFKYTINRAETLTANFKKLNTYALDIAVTNGANEYMIEQNPAPTVVDGKNMYVEGTVVSLKATSNPILTFKNWEDGSSENEITVTMNSDQSLTATYEAKEYIAGWDFYCVGNGPRPADFASEGNESIVLEFRNEANESATWLEKSQIGAGGYEGRPAAVNWKTNGLGEYYWQTKIDASEFIDIKLKTAMLYNYNAYSTQNVEYSLDGENWNLLGAINIDGGSKKWKDAEFTLPNAANNQPEIYLRWISNKESEIKGTSSSNDGIALGATYIYGVKGKAKYVSISAKASPEEAGKVTISPVEEEYLQGSAITLTATNNFGFKFLNWTVGEEIVSEESSFEYTVEGVTELIANFEKVDVFSLDLTIGKGAKDYMVTVKPESEATTEDGKRIYEAGTIVTLTASSNDILSFTQWSNGETTKELTLTMDENKEITAEYKALVDYLAGWDFHLTGNKSRPADFASERNSDVTLELRNENGDIVTWLDKSEAKGRYEGRPGAVNWNKTGLGEYYWQTKFNTVGLKNIKLKTAMVCNYNAYSTQNIEYSIDGENWISIGSVKLEKAKTWVDANLSLPAAANNNEEVYLRWVSDKTSKKLGTESDNDGICLGASYIYGEYDSDAPVLQSSVPSDGATDVAVEAGKISLTFNEHVNLTEGAKATLNDSELTAEVTDQTVTFAYDKLEYETDYTFTLQAGSIFDDVDIYFTEPISITFKTCPKPYIAVTGISLDKSEATMIFGESIDIEATVSPEDATEQTVTWTSDNEEVATVEHGKVISQGVGRANITATIGEFKAICEVKVYPTEGDADYSGAVDINDAIDIANYVVGKKTVADEDLDFYLKAANANGEGPITFADASATVKIALDASTSASTQSRIRAAYDESADALVIGRASAGSRGTVIPVSLENAGAYVAFQADIILPEGMDVEVKAADAVAATHTLMTKKHADNHIRVALFNFGGNVFAAGEAPVIEIVTDSFVSASDIVITDIIASDADANASLLASKTAATNGVAAIGLDEDAPVKVYDINGIYVSDTMEGLQQGTYIVRQGETAKTVRIRN